MKIELNSEEIRLTINSLEAEKKTMQDFISKERNNKYVESAIKYVSTLDSIINKLK